MKREKCPNCGKEIIYKADTCIYCGKPFDKQSQKYTTKTVKLKLIKR